MGLDTAHFHGPVQFLPKPRKKHPSFTCKLCGRTVKLGPGERPKVYCSDACATQGRPVAIQEALAVPQRRQLIRQAQQSSWNSDRQRRLDAFTASQENRTAATRRAAQTPNLRAKRSANAKRRWESDSEFVERFNAAGKVHRRQRVLEETCAKKPHVPFETKTKGLVMVRSKWERDFGIWLDRLGLTWTYEPLRVVVDGRPYTPDFLVGSPFGPCYVEVHRVVTAPKDDQKLTKMQAAAPFLAHPLVLVAEAGIAAIRKQLRFPLGV